MWILNLFLNKRVTPEERYIVEIKNKNGMIQKHPGSFDAAEACDIARWYLDGRLNLKDKDGFVCPDLVQGVRVRQIDGEAVVSDG